MSDNEIREPVQKRSIEKKEKIIKAGFDLICEKGYYNTNTAEINCQKCWSFNRNYISIF